MMQVVLIVIGIVVGLDRQVASGTTCTQGDGLLMLPRSLSGGPVSGYADQDALICLTRIPLPLR